MRVAKPLAFVLAAFACTTSSTPKGELIVEVQTDVALPDSVDQIRIEIESQGVPRFGQDFAVGSGKLLVPATLGILEGADPATPVTIRLIARKNGQAKMLRTATTTIPSDRIAMLRLPIRWLCDDSAKMDATGNVATTCDNADETCVGGDCVSTTIDSSTEPTYDGENTTCFDVVACMGGGTPVTPDASCAINAPAGGQPNVALLVAGDGICAPDGRCFVILDHSVVDGWHQRDDGKLQLPPEVCRRITEGRVMGVLTSGACPTKTDDQPTCGSWFDNAEGGAPTPDAGDAGDAGMDSGALPPKKVYVTNYSGASVTVYAITDLATSGSPAPIATLSGAGAGLKNPTGVALDAAGDLYVANRGGANVTVYASALLAPNLAPKRTLTATNMNAPGGVLFGRAGDVYVSTCPNCGGGGGGDIGIFHFPAGSSTSDGELVGPDTGLTNPGPTIDEADNLYVGNSFGGDVLSFAAHATGDAMPIRRLHARGNTQSTVYFSGALFVADVTGAIDVFPATAATPAMPSSTLMLTGVTPGGFVIDPTSSPPVLYAADQGGSVVVVKTAGTIPNLTIASTVKISGAGTGLSIPVGVALGP